jgi:hypothetical protein
MFTRTLLAHQIFFFLLLVFLHLMALLQKYATTLLGKISSKKPSAIVMSVFVLWQTNQKGKNNLTTNCQNWE